VEHVRKEGSNVRVGQSVRRRGREGVKIKRSYVQ
jgi:hypothetical protein